MALAISCHITPLEGINNLWAMEIDPDSATEEYKERALAPLPGIHHHRDALGVQPCHDVTAVS